MGSCRFGCQLLSTLSLTVWSLGSLQCRNEKVIRLVQEHNMMSNGATLSTVHMRCAFQHAMQRLTAMQHCHGGPSLAQSRSSTGTVVQLAVRYASTGTSPMPIQMPAVDASCCAAHTPRCAVGSRACPVLLLDALMLELRCLRMLFDALLPDFASLLRVAWNCPPTLPAQMPGKEILANRPHVPLTAPHSCSLGTCQPALLSSPEPCWDHLDWAGCAASAGACCHGIECAAECM